MIDGWNGVIFSGFSSGYSVVLGIFGVRGGVIGMWTTTTCAAGIVGFERYKGTLVHLILAPIGALWALTALGCSAARSCCASGAWSSASSSPRCSS